MTFLNEKLSAVLGIEYEEVEKFIDEVKKNEGYRKLPYIDYLSAKREDRTFINEFNTKVDGWNLTAGYGTLLEFGEKKAEQILVLEMINKVEKLKKSFGFEEWDRLKKSPKLGLLEMSYQLGVAGVMKFKKTIGHLKDGDYENAYRESLDSTWAKQTSLRAERVAKRFLS
jgi:lysozyme